MQKVEKKISLKTLNKMKARMFDSLVKAVVDIERKIMVVDAQMHADQEKFLLEDGSKQENLWGINIYPELYNTTNFIEFDSMINIRPGQNNKSRGIEDEEIRNKIVKIVNQLVQE